MSDPTQTRTAPQPPEETNQPKPVQAPLATGGGDFDKWIENFYKECGREATLAYTTLNQMKNWAMLIVAAFVSAVVTLARPSESQITDAARVGMHAAAVMAYVFNVRFFIRAILCYINLTRWNVLQASIVSAYLVARPLKPGEAAPSSDEARAELTRKIQDYFHNWRSPIGRKSQIIQNLKLGFALVLALPLFFVIVWSVELWEHALVRGLAFFAFGSTLVELTDFFRSSYFDTPERHKQRPVGHRAQIFPVPVSQGGYLLIWSLNILVSALIALWTEVQPAALYLIGWLRRYLGIGG
jgi:hypothetical protein